MRSPRKKNGAGYTQGCLDFPFGRPIPSVKTPSGQEASADFDLALRLDLKRAMSETGLSRAQIAAGMTDLVFGRDGDGEITKAQVDSWTAPSREAWRFPLSYLPAFIAVTEAVWLLDVIARRCGCVAIRGEDLALVELARLSAARLQIEERERELRRDLPDSLVRSVLKDPEATR